MESAPSGLLPLPWAEALERTHEAPAATTVREVAEDAGVRLRKALSNLDGLKG